MPFKGTMWRLRYLPTRVRERKASRYWDSVAPDWKHRDPEIANFTRKLVESKRLRGRTLHLLAGANPYVEEGVNADISMAMLRGDSSRDSVRCNLDAGAYAWFPFAKQSFGSATLINGALYLRNPLDLFKEVGRVLIADGKFVIIYCPDLHSGKVWTNNLTPERIALLLKRADFETQIEEKTFAQTSGLAGMMAIVAFYDNKFVHQVITATKQ